MGLDYYTNSGVPKFWYNIVPFIERELGFEIPPFLDPDNRDVMQWEKLAEIIPRELAKQELNFGTYKTENLIAIPNKILKLYEKYRPTPLVRAAGLENDLGLERVKIYFKREDQNEIGSYKLNSSYVQAYYAAEEGVREFIADTGPGNWGMGMAVACKEFGLQAIIYMEKKNYDLKKKKVGLMKKYGAKVVPITTKQETIAASISIALEHVRRDQKNKLSVGCLTAYSALHNTVIGMELKQQLAQQNITPNAMVGVVGGGSSFSGFVFPFIKADRNSTDFIAIESTSVPSFTKGEYKYENPDLIGRMPCAKMYTLGVNFVPKKLGASGLNYHGKNPLLSLLVNKNIVKAVAYSNEEVDRLQLYFEKVEGIRPSPESCYAIKGAIEKAKELNGQDKTIVFLLTGGGTIED
ncbi:MAG: TrpB-like pyridoxal phosphate-dependent enzyme [Patescibacteria group bacterium]